MIEFKIALHNQVNQSCLCLCDFRVHAGNCLTSYYKTNNECVRVFMGTYAFYNTRSSSQFPLASVRKLFRYGADDHLLLEQFSTSTYRCCSYHSMATMSHRADCWTAQRSLVVILVAATVEHWTLPAHSSLEWSAHCRHRQCHWWLDGITDLRHHIHV